MSKLIPYCLFFGPILNIILTMGCGHPISQEKICAYGMSKSKGSTQNKKNKLCTFLKYLPSQPTYLHIEVNT